MVDSFGRVRRAVMMAVAQPPSFSVAAVVRRSHAAREAELGI